MNSVESASEFTKLNSELYGKLTVEENIFFKTIYDNSKEFEKQIRRFR